MLAIPLFDMGEVAPAFSGVLAPIKDRNAERIGITDNFLSDAEKYHRAYAATDHFRSLIELGLTAVPHVPKEPVILDVGSGSGVNSVVPLLQLFPTAKITATDLSPNLLAILRRYVRENGLESQIECICMDATRDYFQAESFDLVFGGSILHHFIDPKPAIANISRAMKPGTSAIFTEPFEQGHAMLAILFRRLLKGDLHPQTRTFLEAQLQDWNVRIGIDKSADLYRYIDDKWLFTRRYFETLASELGLSVTLISHDLGDTPFRSYTEVLLRLGNAPTLTDWSEIDELDANLSPEMKRELFFSGMIVFRK